MRKLEKRTLEMWASRTRELAKSHFPPSESGIEGVRIYWHVYTACSVSSVVAKVTGRHSETGDTREDLAVLSSETIHKLRGKHPDEVANALAGALAKALQYLKDRFSHLKEAP